MIYTAPVPQLCLAMSATGIRHEEAEAILETAGRFASDRLLPLNRVGDKNPPTQIDGKVVTVAGWKEAYRDWCADGWNGLSGPAEFGGQGLPLAMAAACGEIWSSANISFALCPLLTTGAIEAITAHASDALKEAFLPKLVSGEWSGTMNLTEPQAGSDLSQLQCKAKRQGDGTYRIKGSKIYITYGDHDCSANIVHLVLARLDDAPAGTKGISLFLVPKILPDGTPNDLRCHALEHKLGIHGSPTCTMIYGDEQGATAWLIGEENRGLACMFTMMNNARLLVGVQGVALAERATQAAIHFAKERRQGRAIGASETTSPIIQHPDIRRILVEMRARTSAARLLCMATAAAIDAGETARASLLTPLAKAFSTDIAVEVTSAAVQVHGGMGFVEETGVAQLFRDARILPIYEGTNGIQAIDLVTRKLALGNGATIQQELADSRMSLATLIEDEAAIAITRHMAELASALTQNVLAATLVAATPFLRALAAVIAGGYLAKAAAIAKETGLEAEATLNARIFAAIEIPTALSAAQAALNSASAVLSAKID